MESQLSQSLSCARSHLPCVRSFAGRHSSLAACHAPCIGKKLHARGAHAILTSLAEPGFDISPLFVFTRECFPASLLKNRSLPHLLHRVPTGPRSYLIKAQSRVEEASRTSVPATAPPPVRLLISWTLFGWHLVQVFFWPGCHGTAGLALEVLPKTSKS